MLERGYPIQEKVYGVIVEWKEEGPIVMEGKLSDYQSASDRMKKCAGDPRVIRVAIFRAIYEIGNETLIPKGE